MALAYTKSKASTLAKIAALPRFRSPKDLINEPHLPYDIQIAQIKGTAPFKTGKYLSIEQFNLYKKSAKLTQSYYTVNYPTGRPTVALQQFNLWNDYLKEEMKKPEMQLSDQQKQRVYEAMLTAKERNQERLALHRFIKFGYEYAQAFKVDIPLNPIVMMKMVHPHFGYLNNLPNLPEYKYNYEQLFELIEQFVVASQVREKGYTLHSSELVSLIFWKIWTLDQPRMKLNDFMEFMKIFKFNLSQETFKAEFKGSVDRKDIKESIIRFDTFRNIFLDRDL